MFFFELLESDYSIIRHGVRCEELAGQLLLLKIDRLPINVDTVENALKVQVEAQTKLRVFEIDGYARGVNSSSTPDNALYALYIDKTK